MGEHCVGAIVEDGTMRIAGGRNNGKLVHLALDRRASLHLRSGFSDRTNSQSSRLVGMVVNSRAYPVNQSDCAVDIRLRVVAARSFCLERTDEMLDGPDV